jgi:peptidyl-dipeptidase Dcp
MKTSLKLPLVAMLAIFASCENNSKKSASDNSNLSTSNPFLKESTLPYQVPDFNHIKDSDFKPAIEEGMKIHLNEINTIADNTESPTFENTLVAMEKSGQMLSRVNNVFGLLTGANTNDDHQKIKEEIAPKQAAHQDAIYLNAKLFKRIESIYNTRASLKLDAESNKLVEYTYQKFVLAGAKLSEDSKTNLKKLNEQEASLSAKFSNQLLAAAKVGALVTDNVSDLEGLSSGEINAAAQAAKTAKLDGKWLLSLQNTTQQPPLQSLSNRATRQKLFEASWNRAEKSDTNDTRKTIVEIAKIRAEKAKLMGFPNYATWK